MANPGYPMQQPPMGGMPPMGPGPGMGGPGMGGPGMGGPGMGGMRPARRGTSKAVPVVVSAGLAVGVFCGLLFGLGTGSDEATAAPTEKKARGSGETETPDILMAGQGSSFVPTRKPDPAVASAAAGSAAAGSGAGSDAAGSAAGSAAAPGPKMVKLIIAIKPEAAAAAAKITIDGKDVSATSDFEIGDAPKKKFSVLIKAEGFKDYKYEGEVDASQTTMQVELEMQKKPKISTGGGLPRPTLPSGGGDGGGAKKPPGGGGKKPGGLIDI